MGRVIVAGAGRMTVPIAGILASDLAVGTVVKLMEGGAAVEYLVVNQGIPSNSDLYDASCNGTWLLRKDIHSERQWDGSSNLDKYEISDINIWLNRNYFSSLGMVEQASIKQVKIPYRKGGGHGADQSGANGLSTKIFLLSGYEVGWTNSDNQYFPVDGAKLSYFESGTGTSANSKRIANLNNSADRWWLRSPAINGTTTVWLVAEDGDYPGSFSSASDSRGIRPALIIPSTAKFDSTTLILKG